MGLSREEVRHVAELAKLGLTEEEKGLFSEQLSAILDYAERLQELDTEDVPPTAHSIPLQDVMRDDEVTSLYPREDILANAPQSEQGSFKVQAVLE